MLASRRNGWHLKPRTNSPRARQRSGGGLEWIAGLLTTPFFVTDRQEPYRPILVVLMELPNLLVVGQDLVAPEATAGKLGRTLLTAM